MNVNEYLPDSEPMIASTPAQKGTNTQNRGQLACTPERLVFVSDDGAVLDISRDHVAAVEYETLSAQHIYLWSGVLIGFISLVLTGIGFSVDRSIVTAIGIGLFALASLLVVVAYFYRTSELTVHIPSQSYTFSTDSSDLMRVAKEIRVPSR